MTATLPGPSRRALLQGALAVMAVPHARAGQPPARVAIIDWALLETALAIGLQPVGATELMQYRVNVIEPDLPAAITDIGLRGSLNFELLSALHPDLIVSSNFYEQQRGLLSRIAPVQTFNVYEPGRPPYPRAVEATSWLADLVQHDEAARRYIGETEREFADCRAALERRRIERAIVINLGDPRHFRAFGPDSMFGDVIGRLGVANAWPQASQYAAAAPVGLHKLVEIDDAYIIVVGPSPVGAARARSSNAIWNALPAVREGRVITLGAINHFGALPAARRFARELAHVLPDCCT